MVDIACGTGWSSIALAHTYPKVRVEGFDLDETSIDLAKQNSMRWGLTERVTFEVRAAAAPGAQGSYDEDIAAFPVYR
jgi:methylase of polypeptide subunit release factors